jgi:hypothetical protein
MRFPDAISRNDAVGQASRLSLTLNTRLEAEGSSTRWRPPKSAKNFKMETGATPVLRVLFGSLGIVSTAWFRISGVGVYARPHHEPLVAQVSKPAVSPTSKSAGTRRCTSSGFGNPRYSRLGSLRYVPAPVQGTVPGSAGVSPASSGFRLPTRRRDAGAPRRFMVRADTSRHPLKTSRRLK